MFSLQVAKSGQQASLISQDRAQLGKLSECLLWKFNFM